MASTRRGILMLTRSLLESSMAASISTTAHTHPENSESAVSRAIEEGSGTVSPSSTTVSIQRTIASFELSIASSKVSPAEKQPGRSGTTTPKAWVSSPGSMAIGYFMANLLFQTSLFQKLVNKTFAKIMFGVHYADMSGLSWMCKNMMRASNAAKFPTVFF